MAQSASPQKQNFMNRGSTGNSSFYQRSGRSNVVDMLQDEIGRELAHEISQCDYMIRGRDHLGQKTINQYSVVRELGSGAFGTVYMVHVNETHEDLAMKVYSKQNLKSKRDAMVLDPATGKLKPKNYLQEIHKEIEIMKQLNATNVVKLHEVIDAENEDQLILLMDFCAKGEILNWDEDNDRFSPAFKDQNMYEEVQIRKFMRDLVEGLDHLHKSGICHRDIKPMNILVDQDNVCKFADFGSSNFMKSQNDDTFSESVGTFQFFSPEMCDHNVSTYSGRQADIWALGITLYAMTFNMLPFDAENDTALFEKIMEGRFEFGERQISEGLRDLISRMLDRNPSTRITLDDMKSFNWLNEGYTVSLATQGATILANLTNQELQKQGVSKQEMEIAQSVVNRIYEQVNEQYKKAPVTQLRRRQSFIMKNDPELEER